jgi:hypothetical protein
MLAAKLVIRHRMSATLATLVVHLEPALASAGPAIGIPPIDHGIAPPAVVAHRLGLHIALIASSASAHARAPFAVHAICHATTSAQGFDGGGSGRRCCRRSARTMI